MKTPAQRLLQNESSIVATSACVCPAHLFHHHTWPALRTRSASAPPDFYPRSGILLYSIAAAIALKSNTKNVTTPIGESAGTAGLSTST